MTKAKVLLILFLCLPVVAAGQTLYDTAPGAQKGQQPYGSYFSGEVDSVNLFNGNLNLNIALFSLPGRELPVGISVAYNAQQWGQAMCGSEPCATYTGGWTVMTPVQGLNSGSLYVQDAGCVWQGSYWHQKLLINGFMTTITGAKRRYLETAYGYPCGTGVSPYSRNLPSVDSDGSVFYTGSPNSESDIPKVIYRDGSVRSVLTSYNSYSLPHDIATPNGNYLIKGSNGLPTQDTLGRTIQYECVSPCTGNDQQHRYKIMDSNGNLQTYKIQYQSLTVTSDPFGLDENIVLTGLISYLELPNGKRYTFEYSTTHGFITKVILPSGGYVRYVYGDSTNGVYQCQQHVRQRIVSADGTSGSEKTWTYGGDYQGCYSNAKVTHVTSPEGDIVSHRFTAQGAEYKTEWVSASGASLKTIAINWVNSEVLSNAQPRNPRVTETTTYLPDGMLSKKVVTYDSDNYVTQEKVYDWGTTSTPLVFQKDTTYTTIATNFKKVATETVSAINPANSTFETQGKIEYFYDGYSLTDRGSNVPNHTHGTTQSGRGNLTRVLRYKDASTFLETRMEYDNLGNMIKTMQVRDPNNLSLNLTTTVDFTDNFVSCTATDGTCPCTNCTMFAYPKKVTNPLGQYATSQYDFRTGLVKKVTNLRGYDTTTSYDLLNRITSITEPNNKQTTFAYDDDNLVTTMEVTVDDSSNKSRVKTYFDKLYRVIQTRTNDTEGEIYVDNEYDGNGRAKKASNPRRSSETAVWTQTTYDALSRPTVITAADNSTVQYAYFNNQVTTTDPAGNQRRYTHNVVGQLTKVEEPNPTLYTPAETTYKYYGFGPLYQSNQSSQTRTWVHNWLGQMTSQALPESGTTSFTYDTAGRLYQKTDARSIVTTHTYDDASRLAQRSYSDSTPTVTFTYDQSSQTGLRTAMSDALGSVAYTFDTMDRLTQESRTLTGITGTFSTSYAYNKKGDVTQMTYPSGRVVNFGYALGSTSSNSRIASVSDGTTSTTLLDTLTYNAAGGVLTQTLNPGSNDIDQTFTYNSRLQLTQIQAVRGSTTLQNFSYDYGTSTTNTGRVLKRTDSIQPEHSANYVYDSLYRLYQAVGVDSSWAISWGLDTWGNRTSQTPLGLATSKVGSQTRSYSNNRQTNVENLTYDNAGNLTHEGTGGHAYGYNAENQQTSMDSGAATYGYDGEGRRMKKTTSSETTYSFYGLGGLLCEFTTTNTGATAAHSTNKTIYRTSERTGTAVLLFNTSSVVIENNRTLPYGEAWIADVASANDKKFTTYDRDKESGLDYAMARMYAGSAGRMTSPDAGPIFPRKPGSLNRYVYGMVDPINSIDPDGNISFLIGSAADCSFYGGTPGADRMVNDEPGVDGTRFYTSCWMDDFALGEQLPPGAFFDTSPAGNLMDEWEEKLQDTLADIREENEREERTSALPRVAGSGPVELYAFLVELRKWSEQIQAIERRLQRYADAAKNVATRALCSDSPLQGQAENMAFDAAAGAAAGGARTRTITGAGRGAGGSVTNPRGHVISLGIIMACELSGVYPPAVQPVPGYQPPPLVPLVPQR